MPVSRLREFAKGRGLKVYKGGEFRLVFIDATDPIGEMFCRAVWLRYENQIVWGRFRFADPATGEHVWLGAPYYRCLDGFCQMLMYDQVFRITGWEGVKLYSGDEREEVLAAMARMGEEEWLRSDTDGGVHGAGEGSIREGEGVPGPGTLKSAKASAAKSSRKSRRPLLPLPVALP